jgi:hypothetical protein
MAIVTYCGEDAAHLSGDDGIQVYYGNVWPENLSLGKRADCQAQLERCLLGG